MARSSGLSRRSSSSSKGAVKLSGAAFGGLSKGRMAAGQGFSKRLRFDKQRSSLVQFYGDPDDSEAFKEYYVHSFKEDGNWKFVPCAGDECPLDTDEDEDKRRKRYRFCAQVLDVDTREAMVMEGPKDLAQRIFSKYEKAPERFVKRVWEVTQLPTTPISYEVDTTDERRLSLSKYEAASLQGYIDGEISRYHGEIKPKRSSLQADDDEDDEDDRPRRSKRAPRDQEPPARNRTSTRSSTRDEPSSRRSSSSARSSSTRRNRR